MPQALSRAYQAARYGWHAHGRITIAIVVLDRIAVEGCGIGQDLLALLLVSHLHGLLCLLFLAQARAEVHFIGRGQRSQRRDLRCGSHLLALEVGLAFFLCALHLLVRVDILLPSCAELTSILSFALFRRCQALEDRGYVRHGAGRRAHLLICSRLWLHMVDVCHCLVLACSPIQSTSRLITDMVLPAHKLLLILDTLQAELLIMMMIVV